MSLRDLQIKVEYRTFHGNIVNEFYNPLLSKAILYKRAVGFFSSSILVSISDGIEKLVKNGGHIRLIASPKLSEEDISAIKNGYAQREKIIKNKLIDELKEPINEFEKERLNFLANLIAQGYLDIKIALLTSQNNFGMYHEKMGIISDGENNKIAFTGSMNETETAIHLNYETIDTFCSWIDADRTDIKDAAFDRIWENKENNIQTFYFPEIAQEIIGKYKLNDIDCKNFDFVAIKPKPKRTFFEKPDDINLYPYQEEAIENWFKQDCQGIFDMCTGSGKTITALSAVSKLSEKLNEHLAVIIVVPYQHLVEQWCEDIERFGVDDYIKCYSYPKENWRHELKTKVRSYNYDVINNLCVITTNATFQLKDFQERLRKINKDYVIIGDEVHNFGSRKLYKSLPENVRYRLGLSATVNRHYDEEGTERIKKYFGNICINFTIKEAIRQGFLTSYYYYPIINYFSLDELTDYYNISLDIKKRLVISQNKNIEDDTVLEALYAKRSRIISGCKEKADNLIKFLSDKSYIDKYNILIYCGACRYCIEDADDNIELDIRQIEYITQKLGKNLNMKVRPFTSCESKEERKDIIEMFVNKDIQAIIAIKCLDEGVNVPSINTAFILASSTNPKEYIQRRGRVLRKAPGKYNAVIFDFITVPRNKESLKFVEDWQIDIDKSLLNKEIARMREFQDACNNKMETENIIEYINELYGGYYGNEY